MPILKPLLYPQTCIAAAQRLKRVRQLLRQAAALGAGIALRPKVGTRVRAAMDKQQHGAGGVRDLYARRRLAGRVCTTTGRAAATRLPPRTHAMPVSPTASPRTHLKEVAVAVLGAQPRTQVLKLHLALLVQA